MKASALAFELDVEVSGRPARRVAAPKVEVGDEQVISAAGGLLWGEMLDRLGLVGEADRRGLRQVGPGGYSGGECYRPVVELILAGGDFVSDRWMLSGEANMALRGEHPLPSHTTLWRFLDGAGLGRASVAAAVNRAMLARAWAMGAGPSGPWLTIDPDATLVATYGPGKEGSAFSYRHEVGLSPMLGVCGETGDVLAVRARGGSAHPGRGLASFITECVTAIPAPVREKARLWVRVDSAGYQVEVIDRAERLGAAYSITAPRKATVAAAIEALASDKGTVWQPAAGDEAAKGSEVAETTVVVGGRKADTSRTLRLIVRRQRRSAGEQLSLDDLDGWRFHAIITNLAEDEMAAVDIEHRHRLRGGVPEDTIRQLKEDFAFRHAPVGNFYGNWLWWHACALAYNVARWIRCLALPEAFATCRGKRLRACFLNIAARLVRHARALTVRLPGNYPWADAFTTALERLRALPAFA